MKILAALVVFIFLVSCNDKKQSSKINEKQNEDFIRFYDFNLKVDIVNPFYGVESRFLYINSGMDYYDHQTDSVISLVNFKPNTLYYIDNLHNLNNGTKSKDTLQMEIENSQIDTLYYLTAKLFKVKTDNISQQSISKSSKFHDIFYANVELDLGFRGYRYNISLPVESEESSLNKYLFRLKNRR